MTPLFILLTVVVFSAAALLRSQATAARRSHASWEELIAKLEPVPSSGITAVALDYLHPDKGQIDIEPDELWLLIGGMEGLDRMGANADVLLALAAYAERWDPIRSRIVVERMRRDAVKVRRAVRGISLTIFLGVGRARAAFHVHEAATAYHLMRERLMALYETTHAARVPALLSAI